MSISQYILDAREEYRLEVRQRNTWLTRLRWYYLLTLAVVAVITSTLVNDNPAHNRQIALTAAGIGLLTNLALWLLTKPRGQKLWYYQAIAIAQQLLDISLASAVIYFQAGIASRATLLFAVPIVGAGLLFTRSFAYITASLSSIGYVSALLLYRQNNLHAYSLHQVILPAVFYSVTFFIIATIVTAYQQKTASNVREKSYTELLALLRHQLYHPSGVTSAIVDMLEHGQHYATWPAKDKAYLQQLKHENKRQHTLIENLLQAMTDAGELEHVKSIDVFKLLKEEAISCAMGAKRLADLETHLPNKVVDMPADGNQLATAFSNIIGNAFRYTTVGTPVIISADEAGSKVTISIHDKGKGISEAEQRALFSLFTKMESRISDEPEKMYDAGLGLYVSKLIIERHKGKLELASSADYGTNITITLSRDWT